MIFFLGVETVFVMGLFIFFNSHARQTIYVLGNTIDGFTRIQIKIKFGKFC